MGKGTKTKKIQTGEGEIMEDEEEAERRRNLGLGTHLGELDQVSLQVSSLEPLQHTKIHENLLLCC
jgi:hypothetical protein